jgi:hypothetical protein
MTEHTEKHPAHTDHDPKHPTPALPSSPRPTAGRSAGEVWIAEAEIVPVS